TIGALPTLAWVMLVGLVPAVPAVLAAGGDIPRGSSLGWLAVAGFGNVAGLGLVYGAVQRGKIGVVAPIASTEGAVAAVVAVTQGLVRARAAVPFVGVTGLAEVGGFAAYAVGARHGIAIAAVLGSQFAAIAAFGALVVYRERLSRAQVAGILVIAAGVAALSALRA